jgi:Zn-dependent M16 (insulinase) family peptidase
MLSIEAFRKIDPSITEKLTEEELRELYDSFYSLDNLCLKFGGKENKVPKINWGY